jgi:hypothetical protein
MDAGVEGFVVMKLVGFCFGSGELRTLRLGNLSLNAICRYAFLLSKKSQSGQELLLGYPTLGLILNLSEDQVHISSRQLFVQQTAILRHLGK